ncbi:hypothetical protein TNCV_840921 [Trichonephila clavipes]|nr:hypothetical protein TNCV_840921 [Trichonephila clavipes]
MLAVSRSFERHTADNYDLVRFHLNFEGEHPRDGKRLPSPFTNLMRGPVARRVFRASPRRKSIIHLQTSMPSSGFKPKPYGTVVNVTNH